LHCAQNIRWCSDHFELACRNGEIVRVLFAIDACDREVMAWLATSAGISGDGARPDGRLRRASIRDQQGGASRRMVVRQRLRLHRQGHARHRNGLGPQALFHASPLAGIQSIAEAFVKTFKRDYAQLSILPDAETVIALLPAWFEDYNEVHPHSGLKFLSPREFLRLSA
jgi:putative transposase